MPALSAPALDRFVKLCGLLTSEHDGERATAARMASDLLRRHKLTWADVLRPGREQAGAARAPCGAAAGPWKALATLAEFAVRRPALFTAWERQFIATLLDRRTISERQREILAELAELAEKAGA
jgi:hypothetical protein